MISAGVAAGRVASSSHPRSVNAPAFFAVFRRVRLDAANRLGAYSVRAGFPVAAVGGDVVAVGVRGHAFRVTAVARSASGSGDRVGAVGIAAGAGVGGASVSSGAGLAGRLGGYAGINGEDLPLSPAFSERAGRG